MSSAEKFTSTETDEAKRFGEFFSDLLENHKESLVFYLSENAVLDWFGHTIKGPKNIGTYLKDNARAHKYHFGAACPVNNIGFRDTHVIKLSSDTAECDKTALIPPANGDNEVTPPQLAFSPTQRVQTHVAERGQGDGPQNCEIPESPMKKCRLDIGQGDGSASRPQIKYISTEGSVEFRRKSSKKLQAETKWNRPCKLEVAYSASHFENCTIYMIIFQGNMKCRRNLLKDFESCEPDD